MGPTLWKYDATSHKFAHPPETATKPMIFQAHKNPLNCSHWVPWGSHLLSAAGAPGQKKLDRWQEEGVSHIVRLQREDERNNNLHLAATTQWVDFPLSGKQMAAPEDPQHLQAILNWGQTMLATDTVKAKIVVHCAAGLHRTGVALYMFNRLAGHTTQQSIDAVYAMRALTGQELTKQNKKGIILWQTAESHFENWSVCC